MTSRASPYRSPSQGVLYNHASSPDLHESSSSTLGRVTLQVRFICLSLGMLLIVQAMLQPMLAQSGHESVERRFLRSSNAMMRKRVPPRKGPLEGDALVAAGVGPSLLRWGASWDVGDGSPDSAAEAEAAAAANGTGCQRLLWFTALGRVHTEDQRQQLQAALLSARRHAPSLAPVLVFGGEADAELAAWYAANGGHVLQHRLSFLDRMKAQPEGELRQRLLRHEGGFMRLEIPLLVDQLLADKSLDLGNTSTTYALYTDTDVLFLGGSGGSGDEGGGSSGGGSGSGGGAGGSSRGGGSSDLSTCGVPAPQLVMVGREKVHGAPWDTGVVLVNVPALRAALPRVLAYAEEAGWDFPGAEQGLINAFLRQHTPVLEVLPDALSWKAYWGTSDTAALMHWLGPKPSHARCMRCYLANRAKGAAWVQACACSRVPYRTLFQQAPDHGKMYARGLDAFESYMKEVAGGGGARGGDEHTATAQQGQQDQQLPAKQQPAKQQQGHELLALPVAGGGQAAL